MLFLLRLTYHKEDASGIIIITTVQVALVTGPYKGLEIRSLIAQFVINLDIWLKTSNHKNSRLKGKKNQKYLLAIPHSHLGWAKEKPHQAPGRRTDGA